MVLNLLKQHLRWIKFSFMSVTLLTISCDNSYLRQKLALYASDGVSIVKEEDVCFDEVKNYFFVKHCDSLYYSSVVLSKDVRDKNKTFNLEHYGVMYLKNPDHFFEASFIINNSELGYSTIWFNKYPDSVFVTYDNTMEVYFKKNEEWTKY